MSLFTTAVGGISLSDVEAFCQQGVAENVRVEYKRGLSSTSDRKQIAKEVSAMANTLGGIVLVGVDEDRSTHKPLMPLAGIPDSGDPASRIKSICIDAIYPPIEPEVQTCKLDDDRVVVVVRVQQSEETPHSIEGRTAWYVRSDDRCAPRHATQGELEWLINRRAKSEAHRTSLMERCERRFSRMPWRDQDAPTIQMIAIPRFPNRELLMLRNLDEIRAKAVKDHRAPFGFGDPHAVHGGLVFRASHRRSGSGSHDVFSLGQIDQFGTLAFGGSLEAVSGDGRVGVNLRHLILLLSDHLCYLKDLYEEMGYWGLIDFQFSLRKVRKRGLGVIFVNHGIEVLGAMDFDDALDIRRTVPAARLSESTDDLMVEIVREVRWAFGVTDRTMDDEFLRKLTQDTVASRE